MPDPELIELHYSPALGRLAVLRSMGLVGLMYRRLSASRAVRRLGWEDYQQVACFALVRAAQGFDLARGYRWSTYACCSIRDEAFKAGTGATLIRVPNHAQNPSHPSYKDEFAADARRAVGCTLLPAGYDAPAPEPRPIPLLDELPAALATLSPAEREAVEGCYLHGKSQREVARALGVNRGTVLNRLRKGLAKLRDHLTRAA